MKLPKNAKPGFSSGNRLFLLAMLLSLIGVLFVFEASVAQAFELFGDQYFFVKQQAIRFFIGVVLMIGVRFVPMKFWQTIAPLLFIGSLLLLIGIFIPGVGISINGARRWISIFGFTLQPVEVMKFSLVVFFAQWLSKHQRWLPFLFWSGLPILLLMLQPDLGSTLIVASIAVGMYFLAGGSLKKLGLLGLLGVIGVATLIAISPYRMERVKTFLNSEYDPLGAGFHVRQITIALGNGGLIGQGIGKSKQKFSYIPEVSNDSIFAIVAEELGFLGSSVVLLIFAAFFATGASILKQTKPGSFEYLFVGGILIWLATQTILNLAAVVVLVPLTGLPLPFFSYGGSSLIMILLASGIIATAGKKP